MLSSTPPSKTHLPFKIFAVRKLVISHFLCIKLGGRLSQSPASSLLACCFHTTLYMPNDSGCTFPMPRSEPPRSNCRVGNENITQLTMTDGSPERRKHKPSTLSLHTQTCRWFDKQGDSALRSLDGGDGQLVARAAQKSSGGLCCTLTSA